MWLPITIKRKQVAVGKQWQLTGRGRLTWFGFGVTHACCAHLLCLWEIVKCCVHLFDFLYLWPLSKPHSLWTSKLLHHLIAQSPRDVCFHSESSPPDWCPDLKQTSYSGNFHTSAGDCAYACVCALTVWAHFVCLELVKGAITAQTSFFSFRSSYAMGTIITSYMIMNLSNIAKPKRGIQKHKPKYNCSAFS